MMLSFYLIYILKKKYDEKTVFSELRFRLSDIPLSDARIYVKGSNVPENPWRLVLDDPELSQYFNMRGFRKF